MQFIKVDYLKKKKNTYRSNYNFEFIRWTEINYVYTSDWVPVIVGTKSNEYP